MINSGFFSSESVTEGHPDKLCDQISDSILDAVLSEDSHARVACETFAGFDKEKNNAFIVVAGEISYKGSALDYESIVRERIHAIGYDRAEFGLDYKTCDVFVKLNTQSCDIAKGVDVDGAGDQGVMFGFATDETPEKIPLPILLSHKLAKRLADVRKNDPHSVLGPDGKAQISLKYKNKKVEYISDVVVSTQHIALSSLSEIKQLVTQDVILSVLPENLLTTQTKFHINPTGIFIIGGPQGDTGLTGRKIIVDTYGGLARHGGGAFSGKDGTKVDRSGAYMARYIAKNIVAAGLAKMCEIQLAYVIGEPEPVSIYVDTFDTGKVEAENLATGIRRLFALTPSGIIKTFGLDRPIFLQTSVYGHFGKPELPWEKEDKVDLLLKFFHGVL